MSKRIASIHFYDVLGSVAGSAAIREYADYEEGHSEIVFDCSMIFPGRGEEDPRKWLELALEQLLRTL